MATEDLTAEVGLASEAGDTGEDVLQLFDEVVDTALESGEPQEDQLSQWYKALMHKLEEEKKFPEYILDLVRRGIKGHLSASKLKENVHEIVENIRRKKRAKSDAMDEELNRELAVEAGDPDAEDEKAPTVEETRLRSPDPIGKATIVTNIEHRMTELGNKMANNLMVPDWRMKPGGFSMKNLKSKFKSTRGRLSIDPEDLKNVVGVVERMLDLERQTGDVGEQYANAESMFTEFREMYLESEAFKGLLGGKKGLAMFTEATRNFLSDIEPFDRTGLLQKQPTRRTAARLSDLQRLPRSKKYMKKFHKLENTQLMKKFFETIEGAAAPIDERREFDAKTFGGRLLAAFDRGELEEIAKSSGVGDQVDEGSTEKDIIRLIGQSKLLKKLTKDLPPQTSHADMIRMWETATVPSMVRSKVQLTQAEMEAAMGTHDDDDDPILVRPQPKKRALPAAFVQPAQKKKKRARAKHPLFLAELKDISPEFYNENKHQGSGIADHPGTRKPKGDPRYVDPNGKVAAQYRLGKYIGRILGLQTNMSKGTKFATHGPFTLYNKKSWDAVHPEIRNKSLLRSMFHRFDVIPMVKDTDGGAHIPPSPLKTALDTLHTNKDSPAAVLEQLYKKRDLSGSAPAEWGGPHKSLWRKITSEPLSFMDFVKSEDAREVMLRDHHPARLGQRLQLVANATSHRLGFAGDGEEDINAVQAKIIHHSKLFHMLDHALHELGDLDAGREDVFDPKDIAGVVSAAPDTPVPVRFTGPEKYDDFGRFTPAYFAELDQNP